MSTDVRLSPFLRGLLPPTRSYVISHEPKDVEEAERLAKLWKQLQLLENPKVAAIDSSTNELTKYMAQLSASVAAIENRVSKVESVANQRQSDRRKPQRNP